MQKTHLDAIKNNQRLENSYYWWPGEDGYEYGGPAFGWHIITISITGGEMKEEMKIISRPRQI